MRWSFGTAGSSVNLPQTTTPQPDSYRHGLCAKFWEFRGPFACRLWGDQASAVNPAVPLKLFTEGFDTPVLRGQRLLEWLQ
jgi:hypothetical protein